jgi:hypothetical protein
MKTYFNKIKLFKSNSDSPEKILKEVTEFAATQNISAHSLGVEYVEPLDQLIISLGYREEDDPTSIEIIQHTIGNISTNSLAELESNFKKILDTFEKPICHEFFVNNAFDLIGIFMIEK